MATRKSTRSKGKKIPPRRGNEIRTHPLSKKEVAQWERAYKKYLGKAREPFALDEALKHLSYEYVLLGVYLSDKKAFKTLKARAARKKLGSAVSKLLSAIHLLAGFLRSSGVPMSPRSMLRGK